MTSPPPGSPKKRQAANAPEDRKKATTAIQAQRPIVYFRGTNRSGAFVQGYRRESSGDLAQRLYRNRYEDVEIRRAVLKPNAGMGVHGEVIGRVERDENGKRIWWGER